MRGVWACVIVWKVLRSSELRAKQLWPVDMCPAASAQLFTACLCFSSKENTDIYIYDAIKCSQKCCPQEASSHECFSMVVSWLTHWSLRDLAVILKGNFRPCALRYGCRNAFVKWDDKRGIRRCGGTGVWGCRTYLTLPCLCVMQRYLESYISAWVSTLPLPKAKP